MFSNTLNIMTKLPKLIGNNEILEFDKNVDEYFVSYGMYLANPLLILCIVWVVMLLLIIGLRCFGVVYVQNKRTFPTVIFCMCGVGVLISYCFSFLAVNMMFDGYHTINGAITSLMGVVIDVSHAIVSMLLHSQTSSLLMDIAIEVCGPPLVSIKNDTIEIESILSEMEFITGNVSNAIEVFQKDAIERVASYRYMTFAGVAFLFSISVLAIIPKVMYFMFPNKAKIVLIASTIGRGSICVLPFLLFIFSIVVGIVGALALLGSDLCLYDIKEIGLMAFGSITNQTSDEVCDSVEGGLLCYYLNCSFSNPIEHLFDDVVDFGNTLIANVSMSEDLFDSEVCDAQLGAVVTKLEEINSGVQGVVNAVGCDRINGIINTVVETGLCETIFPGFALFFISFLSSITLFLCLVVANCTITNTSVVRYDKIKVTPSS